MADKYSAQFFSRAKEYIIGLPKGERAIIAAHVEIMKTGEFSKVNTKQLRGPVRELIVGSHRISYFVRMHMLCFIEGWRKKSAKTPKRYIDFATDVYNNMV